MKEDVNITQDLKVMQSIVREAVRGSDKEGLTINVIGQMNIGNTKNEETTRINSPSISKRLEIKETNALFEESLVEEFGRLMDRLPEPKFDNALRLMIIAADRKGETFYDASQWLGIGERRYGMYRRKILPEQL